MRVVGVSLAAVAGVQEPGARGELGRDVDDAFSCLQQTLCEWTPHPEAALDGPLAVCPLVGVPPHRGVAGLVGGEPA